MPTVVMYVHVLPGEQGCQVIRGELRSNREAAAELYVSIKGIEFHLSNIFAKLGIRSRQALAGRLGGDAGHAAGNEAARSAGPARVTSGLRGPPDPGEQN